MLRMRVYLTRPQLNWGVSLLHAQMTNKELITAIQDGAVSSSMPVGELLRRCQVIATRLKVPEFAAWVRYELDGYTEAAELPEYRIVHGLAQGHFMGPFGSGVKNSVLPANNLPEKLRDWARVAYLRQPIAAIEEIANNGKQDSVRFAWPGDLIALVQQDFYQGYALAQAWLSVSRSSFVGLVETVRNRILTLALEMEALVEDGGGPSSAATSGAVSQVFNTVIYGTVSNLAQASQHVAQTSGIAVGDLAALLAELGKLGVGEDDTKELASAIEEDGAPKGGKLGKRVAGWMGKMISKAASGTWNVATTTATTVLPKLIGAHYGINL
jgi:hypothetical protein